MPKHNQTNLRKSNSRKSANQDGIGKNILFKNEGRLLSIFM